MSILTALAENPIYHESLVRKEVPDKLRAFLMSVRLLFSDKRIVSDLRRRVARLLVYMGTTDRSQLDGVYVFSRVVESETPDRFAGTRFLQGQTLSPMRLRRPMSLSASPTGMEGVPNALREGRSPSPVDSTAATLDGVIERLTSAANVDEEDLTSFIDYFLSVYVDGVHPLILLRLLRHRLFHHPVFPISASPTRRSSYAGVPRHVSRSGIVLLSNQNGLKAFDDISLPKPHKQALQVLRCWIQSYPWDLEGSPSVRQEIRLLLLQLQDAGSTYALCAEILNGLLVEQVI